MTGFDPAALAHFHDIEEADIVTHGPTGERRTTIWPVVDDRGRLFVRSVRGPRGRWYRDTLETPAVSLLAGGVRLDAIAVAASDAERVAACNAALVAKYRPGASLSSMLLEETLPTTLELVPR